MADAPLADAPVLHAPALHILRGRRDRAICGAWHPAATVPWNDVMRTVKQRVCHGCLQCFLFELQLRVERVSRSKLGRSRRRHV